MARPPLDPLWVWQGIRRATIYLPQDSKAFSRLTMPDDFIFAIRSLLSLFPKECSKRFRGSSELGAILQSDSLGVDNFDIFYEHREDTVSFPVGHRVISLALTVIGDSQHPTN